MSNQRVSEIKEHLVRQIILDLLQLIVSGGQTSRNPDLWKLHIDNATERIEQVYKPEPNGRPKGSTDKRYRVNDLLLKAKKPSKGHREAQ